MSGRIFKFINTFGLQNGIKLYFNRKYKKLSVAKFPFLKYPIFFRPLASNSDLLMFEQIFYRKDYDVNVPVDPKIIVDLGANVGFASVYFANRFPAAKIFALEPNTDNFAIACKNIKEYAT